jgi:hypothetical protein
MIAHLSLSIFSFIFAFIYFRGCIAARHFDAVAADAPCRIDILSSCFAIHTLLILRCHAIAFARRAISCLRHFCFRHFFAFFDYFRLAD